MCTQTLAEVVRDAESGRRRSAERAAALDERMGEVQELTHEVTHLLRVGSMRAVLREPCKLPSADRAQQRH